MCSVKVLAYSDELFKFDLPSTYEKDETAGEDAIIFNDSEDESRGVMIQKRESKGLKKSVWDIEDNDLERFTRIVSYSGEVIDTDKKAKLGKEKAVKIVLEENVLFTGEKVYLEMYILASNKYIYVVAFTGDTEADLDCEDYNMIKDSFKLKDRTTNPIVIYILITIVAIAIRIFIRSRKKRGV